MVILRDKLVVYLKFIQIKLVSSPIEFSNFQCALNF